MAAIPRARKLRDSEAETVLTGGEYEARLRRQFAKTYASSAGWAKERAGAPADAAGARVLASGASLLATPGAHTSTSPTTLPTARLEVSRLADANGADAGDAVVRSVAFHPSGQLLLAAGFDKKVRFFQCDGVRNAKLQTVFLKDMPVHQAAFAAGGGVVVAAGRRRFLYAMDLETGTAERVAPPAGRAERSFERFAECAAGGGDVVALLGARGCVPLLSLKSRCAAGELRMPGSVRAAAFDDSGTLLLTSGEGRGGGGGKGGLGRARGRGRVRRDWDGRDGNGRGGVGRGWAPRPSPPQSLPPARALLPPSPPPPHAHRASTQPSSGGDGVIHTWDLRTRRCLRRDADEGAVGGSALALCGGPGGGSLATGSPTGVVNVYRRGADGSLGAGAGVVVGDGGHGLLGPVRDRAGPTPSTAVATPAAATRPAPARALMNLTTTIDTLAWAPGGQVLACASRMAKDALRIVHGGSLTVFPNWPTSRTPLGHVHCVAFSPGGGLLAVGNAKGRALLYRLHDLPV